MRRERNDHTLPPTAVVHEAVIRLLGDAVFDKAADRNYLFAAASRAMREILIDHARQRAAHRRGGGWQRRPLDLVVDYFEARDLDVVAVHEALERLAELNPRQSQVMSLRYFGGLSVAEVASASASRWSPSSATGGWRGPGSAVSSTMGGTMTPERWQRIDELFDAVVRLDPVDRDPWLRQVCGGDETLRTEVRRLLDFDQEATRDGFLDPPDSTASWQPTALLHRSHEGDPDDRLRSGPIDETGCFEPKAVIASTADWNRPGESPALVQARLRELPIIYIVIFGIMILWRHLVLTKPDVMNSALNLAVIAVLAGIAAHLSGRRVLSLVRLQLIELGMVMMIAGMFAFIQYRVMLDASLQGDPVHAQLMVKSTVLYICILILTYGIYVPKSWRRVAWVSGPLALLPFATLVPLYVFHPGAMSWLWSDWQKGGVTSVARFSFDAMLLVVLAVGSSYGAYTISRLRRQVVEARQLGQYRLLSRIGSGGMGEVYLAEHQLLKRPCAIKLIRPGAEADPKALERFEREVRITATLSHWNTVEIFDYGRTEDGTYYYVMEYLPGLNLAELVERYGPLPPERAVHLLRQVCLALREAHAAGLIHRDVKPSNIFAARRGGVLDVAKLLDFGLVLPLAASRSTGAPASDKSSGPPPTCPPSRRAATPTSTSGATSTRSGPSPSTS